MVSKKFKNLKKKIEFHRSVKAFHDDEIIKLLKKCTHEEHYAVEHTKGIGAEEWDVRCCSICYKKFSLHRDDVAKYENNTKRQA